MERDTSITAALVLVQPDLETISATAWAKKSLGNREFPMLVVLVNILHETALSLEADQSICVDSNLEMLALYSATALSIESRHEQYFEALGYMPYVSTRSLRALLDYLAIKPILQVEWKAMQCKMGLMLANPYARSVWFIMHSSLLYTYETIAKFRRSNDSVPGSIYYVDRPSFQSGPDANAVHDE